MQPEGKGQVIITSAFTNSDRGFDAGGGAIDIPDYRKLETNIYLEYGLTDAVTLVLQPQLRSVSIGAPTDASHTGLGYTDVGVRVRGWSSDKAVVSFQSLVRIPGSHDEDDPAQIGSTNFEVDARGLYGRSFTIGAWPSFIDVQLGYRMRAGDPADEIRTDLTFGVRPKPDVLLLAQSFNTFPLGGAAEHFAQGREHKAALSIVWDVTENWSLQFGGIATVAGENTLRERGAFLAVWRRF